MPNYETLISAIQSLEVETKALRILVEDVKAKADRHEQILVSGDGNRLPLAEVVRNLTKKFDDFMENEMKKQEQWNKLKWIIIAFVVPSFLAFVGQGIIFYFRILPIVERLQP